MKERLLDVSPEVQLIQEATGLTLTITQLVAIKEIVLDPQIARSYLREMELERERDEYMSANERVRGIPGLDPTRDPEGRPATVSWEAYARGVNEGLRCARVALDEKDDDD